MWKTLYLESKLHITEKNEISCMKFKLRIHTKYDNENRFISAWKSVHTGFFETFFNLIRFIFMSLLCVHNIPSVRFLINGILRKWKSISWFIFCWETVIIEICYKAYVHLHCLPFSKCKMILKISPWITQFHFEMSNLRRVNLRENENFWLLYQILDAFQCKKSSVKIRYVT